jgi:light-regulated signal transduction histidine kinase (bacteriophytochrome)
MTGTDFSVTDLANCEREPIHTPGSIQPHGFLFVLDPQGWTITGASTNARELFWREASALIGIPVGDILGPRAVAALERARQQPDFAVRASFVEHLEVEVGGEPRGFTLLAHAAGERVILEGEAAAATSPLHAEQAMQLFLARLAAVESVEELHRLAVTEIRRITGFDRCLLYQFDADWNGNVIAEDRNAVLPAYLHQRFPASDIPRQARELYRRNRLRLIPTNTYKPVPIVLRAGARATGELDLSLSVLRSVSPIHLEYMRNMGTGSSMSISVMRGTELWGLISCHSRDAKAVPFATRAACDLLGQFLSLQLAAREHARELAARLELTSVLTRVVGDLAQDGDFAAALQGEDLLRLAGASGAVLLRGGDLLPYGRIPPEKTVRALAARVAEADKPLVFWASLAAEFPALGLDPAVASGLLALNAGGNPRLTILWFRPEIIEVVEWGGEPRKAIEAAGEGHALHPRKSFEIWRETVRNRARPWEAATIAMARDFRDALLKVVIRAKQ